MGMTDEELIAQVEEKPADEVQEEKTTEVPSITEFLGASNAEKTNETDTSETSSTEKAAGGTDESGEAGEGEGTDSGTQTFTVKYNGEDHEVPLDELLKGYGTNQAAQVKFNDAALARKQAEEFIHQLKTNPWDVLANPELGLDPRALAEQYLSEQLQYEQLTEEQKELVQAKKQLHQFEETRRVQEQQEHDQKLADLTEQYNQEYTTRINDALETANLPNTEASVRRLAGYMSEALNSEDPSIQNLSDSDLCELVREDYESDFKMMFSETDAETLQRILGDDVAKTLRKADIQKISGNAPTRTNKPVKGNKNVKKKEEPAIGMDDFHSYLDSLG